MNKTIILKDHWTGDQAWAALELLYHLENIIFEAYEEQLLKPSAQIPTRPNATSYPIPPTTSHIKMF